MALKNLMIAYNGSETADAALKNAVLMHKKYDAHLTGLLAHGEQMMSDTMKQWAPDSIQEVIREARAEAITKIENKFYSLTTDVAIEKLHWIAERGRTNATVADYAGLYDLCVLGQHRKGAGGEIFELHPDRIALISGRPVLVFPAAEYTTAINEHAILAWDGRRAVSRALSDAMQILETKKLVTILTVQGSDVRQPLAGINVETTLLRHGVKTERVAVKKGRGGVGQAIVDYCAISDAGLLVMGAYEHSKFREDILGGATNTVLRKSRIPVLLSH